MACGFRARWVSGSVSVSRADSESDSEPDTEVDSEPDRALARNRRRFACFSRSARDNPWARAAARNWSARPGAGGDAGLVAMVNPGVLRWSITSRQAAWK